MDQPALDSLASFCAEQRKAFAADAWLSHDAADRRTLAVVAKYLSMTSWYGHEDELTNIASEIDPGVGGDDGFDVEAQAVGFDIKHFSTRLRYRIALNRVAEAVHHG